MLFSYNIVLIRKTSLFFNYKSQNYYLAILQFVEILTSLCWNKTTIPTLILRIFYSCPKNFCYNNNFNRENCVTITILIEKMLKPIL